ncbi:FAR-17a/AIG1-like protein-domain-containing protein [Blakeslea trispora]|nr:FAR-17a/AIG1-like protein-domain-containing protein [Blakeslea trispora]
MSKATNILLLLFGLCTNLYGLYGVRIGLPLVGYGGHYQFLTIIALSISTVCFAARIVYLLTGFFKPFYEALIAIATPIESLVSVLYWPIVLYDRSLLIPEGTILDLPLRLDLCLHLIPTIVSWLDLMIFNKEFKRSPYHILSIYAFAMFYFVWVNHCYNQNGYWVYPIFALFKNDAQRGALFIFSAWVCSLLYKSVVKSHAWFHASKKKVE